MNHNPYQTPAADVTVGAGDKNHAEEVRNEHIKHEAAIRSIAILYYLGVVGLVLAAITPLFSGPPEESTGVVIAIVAIIIAVAALYFWVGTGLRALNSNVRIMAGILAALGLLSFPVGTMINGYILYLLFSKKGKMVFSDEYQRIIDATPHIKYKTSIVVWLLLGLMVLAIGAAIVIPMFHS